MVKVKFIGVSVNLLKIIFYLTAFLITTFKPLETEVLNDTHVTRVVLYVMMFQRCNNNNDYILCN
jgi:hypothetical protein